MKTAMECTCIIPFYNEGRRLDRVIKRVQQCRNIKKIICVDDGSTDLKRVSVPSSKKIQLISLSINQGKSSAVYAGLLATKTHLVFLCDADLINVNPHEIDLAVSKFHSRNVDMIIMRRVHGPKLFKIVRSDILISGERVLKTSDLKKIYALENLRDYDIEPAINEYMFSRKKKVFWMKSSALNTFKIKKNGWVMGSLLFLQEFFAEAFSRFNYTKQLLLFCHEEIE